MITVHVPRPNGTIKNDEEESKSMDNEAKYVCPICENVFSNLSEFSSHISKHADEELKAKVEHEKLLKKQQMENDEKQLKELYDAYKVAYQKFNTARDNYIKKYGSPSTWIANAILNEFFL